MTKREDTIQMTVGGLTLDPVTKTPIVILKDTENKLNLPIWIGLLEATAMATEIEGIKMARPMTHDLLKTVLGEVGCSVESIEITDPERKHLLRAVNLTFLRPPLVIGSRPSDAIALALRTKRSDLRRQKRAGSFKRIAAERRGKDNDGGKRLQRFERKMGVNPRKWAGRFK